MLNNQRGVALLIAIFTFVLVAALSMELLEDTQVDYISANQSIHRLRSYYTAKSGVEMSLLRILIYQKAVHLAGEALGTNASILDQLWSFPFVWPPVLPPEASGVDESLLNSAIEDSLIDGAIATQIVSEGSKLDINDLASPSKTLAKNTKEQILRIFSQRTDGDDAFADLYRGFNFEELVNHMTDWIDEDSESLNGGAEKSYYRDITSDSIPPNKPFKTLEELHMVEGMTDEIFAVLAPQITVYGVAGIQVNTAKKEILMSIDAGITEEIADKIIERRNDPDQGGPFPDLKTFLAFLDSLGLTLDQENVEKERVPLIFDKHINFRITSTGVVGKTTREIVAIVYDFDRVKERVAAQIKKDDDSGGNENGNSTDPARQALEEKCKGKVGEERFECLCQNAEEGQARENCINNEKQKAGGNNNDSNKKKSAPPTGRPNVVFWFEN